jgi:predicted phage terminase large subunit-like protein
MSFITSLEDHQIEAIREYLLGDFEAFSKFCFKIQTGSVLIEVDYHKVMFAAIQKLIDLDSNRMIINIPPRAGKTQIISVFLPLFAWCHNSCGQSILTGFNSDVLYECSGTIRNVMIDGDFKRVFPDVVIDMAKKSVERLGTMSAGVIHAVPTGGKVIGKGAGALVPGFAGLMSVDDIIKPEDAGSPVEREKINRRFTSTLLSRLASETTPLVIIMQRLHMNDLCGFLMKGGTSDVYDWLNIPGVITVDTGSKEWYQEYIDELAYTHVRPIYYDLKRPPEAFDKLGESSFWPVRKDIKTLQGMRQKDPYTFYSQYMGKPVGRGTQALNTEDISYYSEFDKRTIQYTFMTADTAATTKTYSSYTVACFWGVTKDSKLVLIDCIIDKFLTPQLVIEVRDFWRKHNVFDMNNPSMLPKGFYLEDKSSGMFLNQQFLQDGTVTVKPVPRDGTPGNDKFSRFIVTIPYFAQGRILIPKNHKHTNYMVQELLGQAELGSSTGHDDFADNVADAVVIAFHSGSMSYEDWQ